LLCQQHRLALRQHQHPKPQSHPRGHRRQVADRDHHLEAPLLAVLLGGQGDVVTDPQRIEPRLLRQSRPALQRVRFDTAAAL
jgi:hypothetical protein